MRSVSEHRQISAFGSREEHSRVAVGTAFGVVSAVAGLLLVALLQIAGLNGPPVVGRSSFGGVL